MLLLIKNEIKGYLKIPFWSGLGLFYIIVTGDPQGHGLLFDLEDLSNSASHRNKPAVLGVGIPIGSDLWGGAEEPASAEFIIDQRNGV